VRLNGFNLFCFSIFGAGMMGLSGCNGTLGVGQLQGQDNIVHDPIPIASLTPPKVIPGGDSSKNSVAVGTSCHPSDSSHYCVGLKYVVYNDFSGAPVASLSLAGSNLSSMNQVWAKCKIAFQVDQFEAVNPSQYGLKFNTANDGELDMIRQAFDDTTHFLVVTTGKWDRTGSLGNTGANAWTNLPGDAIFGSIMEAPVGNYPNIIAHELGHYMNLNHVSDTSDLMNPIIYDSSTQLTASQCSIATQALMNYWTAMLR